MKIVVTTIMKDEPLEFLLRWAASCSDADERVLVDTGSSGIQVDYARRLGVTVHEVRIDPWRFDDARNAGLALLPDCDVVITLDVDEVLERGWREEIEKAGVAERYSYHYQWNESISFTGERIFSRRGWRWKHPVHESLYWCAPGDPVTVDTGVRITHHADQSKPRSQYLPLLEQAVAESPDDDRMAHYYARELYFAGQWVKARQAFLKHLQMPSAIWAAERAQSYRYLAKMDDHPERWLLKAVAEDPNRREPWLELGLLWNDIDLEVARGYFQRGLRIIHRPMDYMTEEWAWSPEVLEKVGG